MPDVEWHEPDDHTGGTNEELAGKRERAPLSPQARTALKATLALMFVPVIGVAAVRVVHGFDGPSGSAASSSATSTAPASSRSAAEIPPAERTFAIENRLDSVQDAISQAFRVASVRMKPSYSTGDHVAYFANVGRRSVLIIVDHQLSRPDYIGRTAHSVRISQHLLNRRVDVTVSAGDGRTSAGDFEAAQRLVQDRRLLRGS